jgi:hypothetical protein
MNPEIAVECGKLYLKWCCRLIDYLESGNAPVDRAVGWRRNGKTWLPASAWHQIFDENEADKAAAELNRNGLLRTPDGPGLQIIVKVRNKTHRVYESKGYLTRNRKTQFVVTMGVTAVTSPAKVKNSTTVALPALISLPPPPTFPPNFNELPPGQRQDYLDFRKKVSPLGLGWGQTLFGANEFGANDRKWRFSAQMERAEQICSARVVQTSTCSAMARASSTSIPRYLTVLSIFL